MENKRCLFIHVGRSFYLRRSPFERCMKIYKNSLMKRLFANSENMILDMSEITGGYFINHFFCFFLAKKPIASTIIAGIIKYKALTNTHT